MTKTLNQTCTPRASVLDGTADFVVNLADLPTLRRSRRTGVPRLERPDLRHGTAAVSRPLRAGRHEKSASGIYKLSESMGGGKTQSMIVAGILARFPGSQSLVAFREPLANAKPDVVAAFTGRATDKKVWVSIGEQLGVTFPRSGPVGNRVARRAQEPHCTHPAGRTRLLPGPCSQPGQQGRRYPGRHAGRHRTDQPVRRRARLQGVPPCVIVIADLQKDWEQGADSLAKIMRSNDTLGGTMQSVNNEMSKGAQTVAPVDNQKDELYAILRRRLFKTHECQDEGR
jgi:hypothetical protein